MSFIHSFLNCVLFYILTNLIYGNCEKKTFVRCSKYLQKHNAPKNLYFWAIHKTQNINVLIIFGEKEKGGGLLQKSVLKYLSIKWSCHLHK
jgi:hypothetical protein